MYSTALDVKKYGPILSTEEEGGVLTVEKTKVKRPKKYKVLMHNDDYTTMEFVIYVLKSIFSKTVDEAHALMLKVHNEGFAVCGIYSFEIAESKVAKVHQLATKEGHPLKCTLESE